MKLTDKAVAALSLRAGEREQLVADDEMTGLRLRIRAGSKGVSKRWVFKYSRGGTQSAFTLDYPGHNLTAARKRAGELQARLRLGQDPAAERREGRASALQTMAAVLPGYLAHKRQMLRPRSYVQVERHLMSYFEPLHRYPLSAITPAIVSARCAAIAAGSGATTAKNSWRSTRAFFFWAVRQGLMERNPAVGIEHSPDRKRDRILTASELRAVWQATAGDGDFSAIVRLLLLTGCRLSEIGALRWSEIYSDRLVIGAERVKNHRAHTVPLTPMVRSILEARPRHTISDCVFGREQLGFTGWGSSKRDLDKRNRGGNGCQAQAMGAARPAKDFCDRHLRARDRASRGRDRPQSRLWISPRRRRPLPPRQLRGTGPARAAGLGAHILEIADGRIHGDRVVPLRA